MRLGAWPQNEEPEKHIGLLVALGGNVIKQADEAGTTAEQFANCDKAADALAGTTGTIAVLSAPGTEGCDPRQRHVRQHLTVLVQ